jgi:hypothetical protein
MANELKKEDARIPRKSGQPAKSDKHSDLYTDEDPKGTIHGLKFATPDDAKASVSKIKSSGRSHAHKMQAAIAMEQRAKVMGKAGAAAVYRSFINSMKDKTEEMREATDLKDRFKKYIKPTVKTTPKMERIANPAGRTTDHVEYKVTEPTGMIQRFKSKREAQAHFDSLKEDGAMGGSAGPTNVVSSGAIAGSGLPKGGEPGVYLPRKKKSPVMMSIRRKSPKA